MKNKYFVSIVGKSNVGKSTLINHLCEQYVTSESSKPETTRLNIIAETMLDDLNLIIIDTPGLSIKDSDLLSTAMKNSYLKSLEELDLLIILSDITKSKNFEKNILDIIKTEKTKAVIVINKIDLFSEKLTEYQEFKKCIIKLFKEQVFFISLRNHEGLSSFIKNGILKELRNSKIKNKRKFDKKRNELIEIQELIRGVIINNTYQELPYDAAVMINKSTNAKSVYKIDASIFVDKINQRKILIGGNGDMIKLIGSKSRNLLESKYNKKFYLKLNVCVKKNWKNNYSFLKEIGYIA